MSAILRKAKRLLNGTANLARGYNLYVNREKLRLIDQTFSIVAPDASSFADLGGVWRVNAAYARYIIKRYPVERGVLVDTDYPGWLMKRLRRIPRLDVISGDFASPAAVSAVGKVDIAIFFDVLLHQANPHWDDVLSLYAKSTDCIVIYNQQYVAGSKSIRLTDLPLEEYTTLTSERRAEFYKQVYSHRDEIHPGYQKPWGDIHSIAQWGITDADLREHMASLGYTERYFRNYGRFLDLPAFENHAFIFARKRRLPA
ncbi:MAG: hypothetical protein WBH56_17890 [Bacteroidota bacterium]